MSRSSILTTLAACMLAGFFFVASILLRADAAFAQSAHPVGTDDAKHPHLKSMLDESDEKATLEALQLTLTEVGDGSTFVWYRSNGLVSGVFNPTSSFKDVRGRVCRHLRMMLTSGGTSRKAEGVACREQSGVWVLEG